jgi:hypothetical protein
VRGLSVTARYYFNLTNGETMIRDEEGIEAFSIQAAVISAMEAVEELRAQDPSNSEEWQGWWLEIVDASVRPCRQFRLMFSLLINQVSEVSWHCCVRASKDRTPSG